MSHTASKLFVFSVPYIPIFGLNTKRHGVSLCIQSKCGKLRTRKTPNTDTFKEVLSFEITEQIHPLI